MAVKAAKAPATPQDASPVDSNNLDHITPRLRPLAVPMDSLTLDPTNARKHDRKNLDAIKGSLGRFGQRVPLVVNSRTNIIEKGNGTFLAARERGWTHIAVVDVDDDPLDAAGYAIADNRTGELAEWDYGALGPQLEALNEAGFELGGIGFDVPDLDEALALWRNLGNEEEEEGQGSGNPSDGSLLALANVTIDEPSHIVERGEVWQLGRGPIRHVLVCADVLSEWPQFVGILEEGDASSTIFASYPGPFVPLSAKAKECRLVMVQPDSYIAGHILDQWCAVHGEGAAKKVKEATVKNA